MSEFISPFPRNVSARFESPRSNHLSASGLSASSYRAIGYWTGTMNFAPTVGDGDPNPLPALSKADLPNRGFFVDLQEGGTFERDASDTIAIPEWITPQHTTNGSRIRMNGASFYPDAVVPSTVLQAGMLISFRQSSLPQYVTARRISLIENIGTETYALLDTEVPQEFFPVAAGTSFQFCINRPHCRARFVSAPVSWRKQDARVMQVNSVSWIEDTAAIVSALRSISNVSGVEPDAITTQSGIALTDENGNNLVT